MAIPNKLTTAGYASNRLRFCCLHIPRYELANWRYRENHVVD